MQDIKNAVVPYNTVGLLEVMWIPLAGPEEENDGKPVRDIDNDEVKRIYIIIIFQYFSL
jgi:hypothetical protein